MRRRRHQATHQRSNDLEILDQKLRALPQAPTRDLRETWRRTIGLPMPEGLSRDLIMRFIADRLQEAVLGGLPPRAKRRLATLGRSAATDGTAPGIPMLRLKPGSTLVREWHGKTHTVLVLEDGFEHQGKRYASLTQIARDVTGARWSGPRFFGLAITGQNGVTGKNGHASDR